MWTLTIKQPWAALIAMGIKDVENRSWVTDYRGPLLIHAGRAVDDDAMARHADLLGGVPMLSGCLIGVVRLDSIDRQAGSSEWEIPGHYFWRLTDARRLRPVPYRGKLGMWKASHPDVP